MHPRTALHFLVKGAEYSLVNLEDGPAHAPAFGSTEGGIRSSIDGVNAAIDILLAHGARIDAADPKNPWTPLIESRDARIAEHLLARGATDSIFYRARAGDAATVRGMLAQQPELARAIGPEGATPLSFAAWGCSAESCQALIAAGADPAARDHEGRTALNWLFRGCYGRLLRPECTAEQVALAQALATAGAPWDLDSAIFAGAPTVAASLMGTHPDPLAFKTAVSLGRSEIATLILDRGVDVNANQVLLDAVWARNAAMVRLLLERGAGPDLVTNYGTPRAIADRFRSAEVSAAFADWTTQHKP